VHDHAVVDTGRSATDRHQVEVVAIGGDVEVRQQAAPTIDLVLVATPLWASPRLGH
jgi:hypothetical protein